MPGELKTLGDQEQRALSALMRGHAGLQITLDHELNRAHGIGLADYEVLAQLSAAPGRSLRMTELARQVLLSPSGMTRRLDGLVKKGLVERRRCPSDGRGLNAVLSDAGLDTVREMTPTHVRGIREHFIDRISAEQLQQLIDIFEGLDAAGNEATCQAMTGAAEELTEV